NCSARGGPVLPSLTPRQLEAMSDEEFQRQAPALAGCYAYSLGHTGDGVMRGPRFDKDQPNSFMPILADRPPLAVQQGDPGNSPTHKGRGQNVLFLDGHCAWKTTRNAGYNGDDIYLNLDGKVAAGKHPLDAVLAESTARPSGE